MGVATGVGADTPSGTTPRAGHKLHTRAEVRRVKPKDQVHRRACSDFVHSCYLHVFKTRPATV